MLPIYQRGILYGDSNIREVAASGLGELIVITASKYLAGPFTVKMTGPLLRIVGDRNPPNVKVAIIKTLGSILQKAGPALRAFVPQFQTTFVKALSDPSRQVRIEATKALALLMPLSTRVDPLIKELVGGALGTGIHSTADSAGLVAIQTATLEALSSVIRGGGDKAKLPDTIPSSLSAGMQLLTHADEGVREGAAKIIGSACDLLGVDTAVEILQNVITKGEASTAEERHGHAFLVFRVLASKSGQLLDAGLLSRLQSLIVTWMSDDSSMVRQAACIATGAVIGVSKEPSSTFKAMQVAIMNRMDLTENMDVHRALARGLCVAVRLNPKVFFCKEGLNVLDGALRLALSGTQRVQLSYNDFLWLALDVKNGDEGIDDYTNRAMFENSKSMKALHSKVLVKMKDVADEE